MARVPYVAERDLEAQHRRLLAPYGELGEPYTPHVRSPPEERSEGRDGAPPRLYRTLVHNPPILEAFRRMSSVLRAESGLDERRRELVILTVARATESEYEWHKHVGIALVGSITPGEIRAIGAGRYDVFDGREAALLEYVDRFASGAVSDAYHTALAEYVDRETIVGIVMLAQFYLGLAHVINALEIELEEEFVGWTLERGDAADG